MGLIKEISSMTEQEKITVRNTNVSFLDSSKASAAMYSSLQSQVNALQSGAPQAFNGTFTQLQAAYPNGSFDTQQRPYSYVCSDGYRYFWNGTAWAAGGAYQSTIVSDHSIDSSKTTFLQLNPAMNIFDGHYVTGYYVGGAVPQDFSKNVTRKVIMLDVEPNAKYSVIKEETPQESGMYWFKLVTDTRTKAELMAAISNRSCIAVNGAVDYGVTASSVTHYTFTTGANDKTLLFSASETLEPLVQIVKGTQTNLSISSYDQAYKPLFDAYTKGEVDNLIPSAERKIKVIKTGQNLTIYVPCKTTQNYIRYDYNYLDISARNYKQWRVYTTYAVDSQFNVLYSFDDDTEWEGAIWEYNAADFIAGYHGDETNSNISVLIDNKPYNLASADFTVYAESEIRIVNNSILNRCNAVGDNVFNRCRVNVWTKDNYTIENKLTALQAFHIKQAKLGLMSCKYTIAQKARTNHDYAITDMSTAFGSTGVGQRCTDVTKMEIWGDSNGFYGSVECEFDDKYPNRNQYVEDFRDASNRCKLYFDITGDYQMTTGEVLRSKSTIYLNA